jgi:hypothetical protein
MIVSAEEFSTAYLKHVLNATYGFDIFELQITTQECQEKSIKFTSVQNPPPQLVNHQKSRDLLDVFFALSTWCIFVDLYAGMMQESRLWRGFSINNFAPIPAAGIFERLVARLI